MDGMLQPVTAFDVWSGITSAALYVIVGVAALARAPRDVRTRTFCTISIASITPYLLPSALSRLGTGRLFEVATVATALSLAIGSVALFHFAQVFPARRPWIRAHGRWLAAAYAALAAGAAVGTLAALPIVHMMSDMSTPVAAEMEASGSTLQQAIILLFVLIPTIFIVAVVLPFAGLLSLYKSWQEAKRDAREGARVTTMMILVSQLAGGVLTILIVLLLGLVAPTGPWVTVATALLFGCGLLFPIALAMGVWKYAVVS